MARKNLFIHDHLLDQIATVQEQHDIHTETQAINKLIQIGILVATAPDRGEAIIKRDEAGNEVELMIIL